MSHCLPWEVNHHSNGKPNQMTMIKCRVAYVCFYNRISHYKQLGSCFTADFVKVAYGQYPSSNPDCSASSKRPRNNTPVSVMGRSTCCTITQNLESRPKLRNYIHTEATAVSTNINLQIKKNAPGTLVSKTQCFRAIAKTSQWGGSAPFRVFIVPLPWIVTYRFPAIHGFHPEPTVLFRQRLHGDNPWPTEKGKT